MWGVNRKERVLQANLSMQGLQRDNFRNAHLSHDVGIQEPSGSASTKLMSLASGRIEVVEGFWGCEAEV